MSEQTLCLELTVENALQDEDKLAYAASMMGTQESSLPPSTTDTLQNINHTILKVVKKATGADVCVGIALNEEANFDVYIREIPMQFDSIRDLILDKVTKAIEAAGYPVLQYTEVI